MRLLPTPNDEEEPQIMAKDEHLNQDISFPDQKIVDINLEHEMENAYIE